ncbi:multidrug efflux pump [Endobacter medicaginis]|uniref:Efflux RND transporter permease subunit n=1 Tax=Endobacter medicaginis TaxID=1181271 RepID=A0A850NPQ5_9PROT|nr:efflux RND transporter permease subunit [Endobacter medicaginis]MBB3174718.1 multidrug efflux pump [Endobacter medicaginis]MCX5474887.1 efflux RND transporter permease subunit [Endobacter medicaginis]NVN30349.1 efflux RND transporter permease subunit [Endobacter medicaginis]
MNPTAPFIARPVATLLLAIGLLLGGVLAFTRLPASDLPALDLPVILVAVQQPGGTPSEVAANVAAPIERHLGQIAGVDQITSDSTQSGAQIVVQFDSSRNVDAAARDVEAALQDARLDLPTSIVGAPTYFKINPATFPIYILSLTSPTRNEFELYDLANNLMQRRLSNIKGVGQVQIFGSSKPAVRVELDPLALFQLGLGPEDVRAALSNANAQSPKGFIDQGPDRLMLETNDRARKAADFRGLIIGWRNGAPIHLSDVATLTDAGEDRKTVSYFNGHRSVAVVVNPQTSANVIRVNDTIRAILPQIVAALPPDVHMDVSLDRSVMIRSSLHETAMTLLLSVVLVVLVVLAFLRSWQAVIIPAAAIAISIVATFGAMELAGYSLNTLSLMALTIAVGFVVDDAIVVLENVARFMEMGYSRREAALRGAGEVAFTVISITVSLVAVFLPLLLMPGIAGMLLKEFSGTMVMAVSLSLVVSLTLAPMLCSRILTIAAHDAEAHPTRGFGRIFERGVAAITRGYERSLVRALRHRRLLLASVPFAFIATIAMVVVIPKEMMPSSDTGTLRGILRGEPSISFSNMNAKLLQAQTAVLADPDVESLVGFIGGGDNGSPGNTATSFIKLKDKADRTASASEIGERLNRSLRDMVGAEFHVSSGSIFGNGGRSSDATNQYTLHSDNAADLDIWMPRLVEALRRRPELSDVSSDHDRGSQQASIRIIREAAARYGVTPQMIANTLFDYVGQRQVTQMHEPLGQYAVVMEAAPRYSDNASLLDHTWVTISGGSPSGSATSNTIATASSASSTVDQRAQKNAQTNALAGGRGASTGQAISASVESRVPLDVVARVEPSLAALTVSHDNGFAAATLSFNLPKGGSLAAATAAINQELVAIHAPSSLHGALAGDAAESQKSALNEVFVLIGALALIYVTLGILYESFVHPITILSTLPSAGAGAVLALLVTGQKFSIMALLAIVLLIGIVKKNAILVIDFAIQAEREEGLSPIDAVHRACVLRFRPIIMTTLAAAFGAIPLVAGHGYGSEIRRPLGIAVIGGLVVSQALTLYSTPAVYLFLDRVGHWAARRRDRGIARLVGASR